MKESEAAFQTWFLDLAHLLGWARVHFRAGLTNRGWKTPIEADSESAGWPDWVLVRPGPELGSGRIVWAELKGTGGSLTGEQADWLGLLLLCGMEAYCFWPEDRELIERILR